MKVLIFGFGIHGGGFAAAKYFADKGAQIRITDLNSKEKLGDSIRYFEDRGAQLVLGEHRESDFVWADIVVKNPAIKSGQPFLSKAKKVVNDFSCLFNFPGIDKIKIIAITGTKGKTTTAAAVAHVLESFKKDVIMCGNMGISAFSVLEDLEKRKALGKPFPDFLVCELSSFQLADTFAFADHVPVFQVSCLTSFYEDHKNYYKDTESYINDKLKLFKHKADHIVSSEVLLGPIAKTSGVDKSQIVSIEKVAKKTKTNVLAPCYAICQTLGYKTKTITQALKTFPGVPHRNEMVRFYNNVIFINDSAATLPEAAEFTFENFYSRVPVFLICGGTDKGLKADGMKNALGKSKARYLLDGTFTREKLIPLMQKENLSFKGPYKDMASAVKDSYSDARKFSLENGKKITSFVLLSPGAASFEFFLHEFDRGDQFRKLVNSIHD